MDAPAFDAFYAESFPRLVGQIYAMCGDLVEAQDCVQEAFVRAWCRRNQLADLHSPEAWIRTVAWRLAVSRWRRTRRSRLPADRSRLPAPPPVPNPDRVALIAALAQIPARQRRVIVLHHICDMAVKDVATEVGAPVGTVKAWLSRGRALLTSLLDESEPQDELNPKQEEIGHA